MAGSLPDGHALRVLPGNEEIRIISVINSGGQGEVYRVSFDSAEMAVKWYHPSTATPEQRVILERLIATGQGDQRFVWPLALVVSDRVPRQFGYLMRLLPAHYASLPDLFRRRVPQATFGSITTACIHLAEAYRSLHAGGMAYRDINWGNVSFDPVSGDVLICDNDNAIFEGEPAEIGGTMEFMAPEVVRHEAAPRTQTDLHSLAVLLFMMLVNHHPLEGALEQRIHNLDPNAMRELYGRNPVFIFDPHDESNRPIHGVQDLAHSNWNLLPTATRKLFIQAFTAGLHDADGGRVRETQWRDTLSRQRDQIVVCARCDRQNYFDLDNYRQTRVTAPCWNCKQSLVLPPRLRVGDRVIVLNMGATVHPHHLNHAQSHDFASVIGEVTQHPNKPEVFGLTNRSREAWTMIASDGTVQAIEPGRTAPLRNGLRLRMGTIDAEVRAPTA